MKNSIIVLVIKVAILIGSIYAFGFWASEIFDPILSPWHMHISTHIFITTLLLYAVWVINSVLDYSTDKKK